MFHKRSLVINSIYSGQKLFSYIRIRNNYTNKKLCSTDSACCVGSFFQWKFILSLLFSLLFVANYKTLFQTGAQSYKTFGTLNL